MWYNGQGDAFLGLAEPGIGGLGAVRRADRELTEKQRARIEKQTDRLIAARQRACGRKKNHVFTLISRSPIRSSCERGPTPAPVPTPTPEPGLPTPPGTVVAPGVDKLPRGQLIRLLNMARQECKRKGGHLTIKSLRPLEYTCEYFGAAPAPVTPPPGAEPPIDLSQPPYAAPAGAQWQWTGTAWQLIPISAGPGPAPAPYPDYGPPAGGGYAPGGGPTFDTAGGGIPGGEYDMPGQYPIGPPAPGLPSAYPGAAPGAPLYEPLPEGMQPEEEFRDQVPAYQDAGFPPSPFMPYDDEAMVDVCNLNSPEHTSDEFGPLNTLQIVCAPPPDASAPSGGFDFATVPQAAVEYGDIQAMDVPESSMFGMGAHTYDHGRIKKCRRIQRMILKIESAMRSNDAKLRALFAKYGYTNSNPPLGVMSAADQKIYQELFVELRSLDEQHRMAFNLSVQFRCAEVNFGERPEGRGGMGNIVLLGRYVG